MERPYHADADLFPQVSDMRFVVNRMAPLDVRVTIKGGWQTYSCDDPVNNAQHALMRAARNGSLRDLRILLDMGVPANCDERYRKTSALAEAAANGWPDCVRTLLLSGANCNRANEAGLTPLMLALQGDHAQCCAELLANKQDIKLDAQDSHGKGTTVLMYAARVGNYPVSRAVYERHGVSACNHLPDAHDETVITYAGANGHKEYLRLMVPLFHFKASVVKAVAQNDEEELQRLLSSNTRDYHPNDYELSSCLTGLMLCSMLDNRKCFDLLLQHPSINVGQLDDCGRSALHYAAACSNLYCVERLLEHGAEASQYARNGQSVLHMAAMTGAFDCAKAVLRAMINEDKKKSQLRENYDPGLDARGDEIPQDSDRYIFSYCLEFIHSFDKLDARGKTALMDASERGHLAIVRLLLNAGTYVDVTSRRDAKTALMLAASSGHVHIVEELYVKGADVDYVDDKGWSALHHAVRNRHFPCVQFLLRVADATIFSQGDIFSNRNTLTTALYNKDTECAELLIECMTSTELHGVDSDGCNKLMYAARYGDVSCFKFLLQRGLSETSTDAYGNTMLMFATSFCQVDMIEYLLENSMEPEALINARNNKGINALCLALHHDLPVKIVHNFIHMGASVDCRDLSTGSTALMFAGRNGNESTFCALLAAGADIRCHNKKGHTALTYAVNAGAVSIVTLALESERAKGVPQPDTFHRRALLCAVETSYAKEGQRVEIIKQFLRMGFFRWSWYPHFMIQAPPTHKQMLLRYLVFMGIPPGNFEKSEKTASPFILALRHADVAALKFLIANLYFTWQDYQLVLKDRSLFEKLEEKGGSNAMLIVSSLRSNALPLATLCFIKISSAVSSHCGDDWTSSTRMDTVDKLPLPEVFKRKLLFQEPVARICHDTWYGISITEEVKSRGGEPYSLFLKFTVRSLPEESRLSRCDCDVCKEDHESLCIPGHYQRDDVRVRWIDPDDVFAFQMFLEDDDDYDDY